MITTCEIHSLVLLVNSGYSTCYKMDSFTFADCMAQQADEIEAMRHILRDTEFHWDESKARGYIKITFDSTLEVSCRLKDSHGMQRTLAGCSKVKHLPPVLLCFDFPALYPAERSPLFTLSSCWLNFTQVRL